MSDQFNNFSFDLQRFASPSSVYYSLIGESSAATKAGDSFYWGASGALIQFDGSPSALLQVNYDTVATASGASTSYYSVTEIADWVSLAGANVDYKFTSISGTEDFNIIGLGDNTVEGLKFMNGGASVPTLNFSGAGDSSKDYLEIANGALSNIALGTTSAALTVNENSSSITWSINGQSLALDSNFTFAGNKTLELLGNDNATVNFTYANAVNKISGLSSKTIDGLTFAGDGGSSVPTLYFSGAGASDYLDISGGLLNDISLNEIGAALTVKEGTFTNISDYNPASGLFINKQGATDQPIGINQGFTYTVEGESARTIEILAGGTSVVVADSGDANKIYLHKDYTSLQIDSDTYEFENVSGSVYFAVENSAIKGFNFGGNSDALILNDVGTKLGLDAFLVGGSAIFNSKFNLDALNPDDGSRTKKLILNNKDTGEFLLDGLAADDAFYTAEDIHIYFSDQYHSDRNPIGGGSVTFYAASGAIKEITVGASGILMIEDDNTNTLKPYTANGADININGADVNVKSGFTGTVGFIYNNLDKDKPILELNAHFNYNDLDFGEDSEDKNEFAVSKWGKALELSIGYTSGTNVTLGNGDDSVAFILTTNFDDPDNYNYETLGKFTFSGDSKVSGFIFGADSGTDNIIFDSTFKASGFSFGYTTDGFSTAGYSYLNVPNVTLAGAGSGAVAQTSVSAAFTLVVGGGSATVADNDASTQVKFDGGASGFFQIAFDEDGELQGIIPVVSLSNLGSSSFADGMAFTVSGNTASNSASGLYFGTGTNNTVAIASGSYVYTYKTGGGDVELVNGIDTVYALADAKTLKLGGTSGTITDALNGTSSTDDDFTYQYRSGGSAYFTVGASALSAFVFAATSNAIGMSAGNKLGLEYVNGSSTAGLSVLPTVTGTNTYWVEMTGASGSEFAVNTFGGAASVAIGSASFTFAGGSDNSALMFNAAGSALGFNAAAGSVAMNNAAASYLADGVFSINGASVDIAAQGFNDTLTYIAGESALLGLGDKSTITNAGNITKIYAASSAATFTFGSISFTANAAGTSTGDLAYYDVNGASATGFHFMLTNDALTLPGSVGGFKLHDGANGTGFDAPTVSVTAGGSEVSSYTVVKQAGDSLFAVAGLSDDNYAEFDRTHITFETLSAATGEIFFTAPSGALVGISGLDADNDAVRVTGATGGISIMGKTVEIVGPSSGFLYTHKTSDDTITEIYGDATIKAVADATVIGTAAGQSGLGQFTFNIASPSQIFTVAGSSNDGVSFQLGSDSKVVGVNGVDNNESVTGAFFTNGSFSLNNAAVSIANGSTSNKTNYTFYGASLAGLVSGDNVTKAGGVSYFITSESGAFTILNTAMTIGGDSSVVFGVNNNTLSTITDLGGANAYAYGSFSNAITVNTKSVNVTGDNLIAVYGNAAANGVAKIGSLSGTVDVVSAEGVTMVGADGVGQFTFTFAGHSEAFTINGTNSAETWFTFGATSYVAGISGIDAGETVTGNFSHGIDINGGNSIQVTGDDNISVASVTGALEIADLGGGATVAVAGGVSLARTETIGTGTAAFTFVDETFSVSGDTDGVDFVLDGNTVVKEVNDLDVGATLRGGLSSLQSVNNVSFSVGGDNNFGVVGGTGASGIRAIIDLSNNATVSNAGGATLAVTDEQGTFQISGVNFTVSGDSSVNFILNSAGSVVAVDDLDANATLRGDLTGLSSINGISFVVGGDTSLAVVGAASGISRILDLSNGATLTNSGGASQAVTDTVGMFTFDSKTFTIAGDSSVTFGLSGAAVTSVTDFNAPATITGEISGLKINNDTTAIGITGDSDSIFSYAIDSTSGATLGAVGGSSVAITHAAGANVVQVISGGNYQFGTASAFTLAGTSAAIDFMVNGLSVTAVGGLNDTETLTGYGFGDITAINGATFDIKGDAGDMMVVGNTGASGLTVIGNVGSTDGVTINNVGGAEKVSTDMEGVFDFANPAAAFTVSGDSSVEFVMAAGQSASVIGVENFDEPATIAGALNGVYINDDTLAIEIDGDSDSIFSYAVDGSTTLGSVGGDNVTINGAADADVVQVVEDGNYNFFGEQKYTLATDNDSDGVNFVLDGTTVTAIESFDKGDSITGDFTNEITVSGGDDSAVIQVAGDNTVMVEHDAILIRNLSNGATISVANDVYDAWTDSFDGATLAVTDADGRNFTVTGTDSDGVNFKLDGQGHILGVEDLDSGVTLEGNVNELETINGAAFDVKGDDTLAVVGAANGVSKIFELSGGATVNNAAGASQALTDSTGNFYFGGQSFVVGGDSSVTFGLSDDTVNTISELSGSVTSNDFADITSVNGQSFDIAGDDGDLKVVGNSAEDGIDEIANVGASNAGIVTISATGGATKVTTDKVGTVEFPNQSFTVDGDSSVTYGLSGDTVTAIDELNGTVTGDFTSSIAVDGEAVQVSGDSSVKVVGNDTAVSALGDVDASSTVNAWGSASAVSVVGNGNFAFTGGDGVTQTFTGGDTVDNEFVFNTDSDEVTGVSELQDGTLTLDTNTDSLGGNLEHYPNQELTFNTTKNVNLTFDDWKVVEVSGVTGSVSGLIDATVIAEGPVTVNGKSMDITDSDDYFGVVVSDGSVEKATSVTGGDATVNVDNGKIETDGDGYFNIGGEEYTFGGDSNFTLYTDDDSLLVAVDDLDGWIVDEDGNTNITINGAAIETKGTSSPVTISADESGITGVDGLESGDTVNGVLGHAAIHLPGSTSSARLTVNGKTYTTYGDEDGITITGMSSNVIDGLDEGATLKVSETGDYTINTAPLHVRPIDAVIGIAEGEYATIVGRDETTLLIRKNTAINHGDDDFNIEDLTHVPHNHTAMGSESAPWDKDFTDAIASGSSTVDINLPLEAWLDNDDNTAAQTFDVSKTRNAKKIHLMDGEQSVVLGDANGNFVHVMTVASGNKNITLGNGSGDVVLVDMASVGTVSIVGGTGKDSIIVRDSAPVTFDMSKGGADMVLAFAEANSRISLEGYDATTGAAVRIEEWNSSVMAEAIESRMVDFGDGVIIVQTDEGKSKVDIDPDTNSTKDGWFVNLLSYQKDPEVKTLVGFTGTDGGSIDASNFSKPAILIGNMFDEKSRGSTITGTARNDTIYGGAGDSLNGGGGKDFVTLVADDSRDGAVVNISNGRTTIVGTNNVLGGFTGDIIEIDELDITQTNIKLVDGNLIVKDKNDLKFHAVITDVSTLDGGAAPYTTQLFKNSLDGQIYRAAIGAESSTMYVTDDEENRPYVFIGINSEVDFTGYSGDVVADLTEDWHLSYHGGTFSFNNDGTGTITYNGGTRAYYEGVNKLRGGKGKNILKGGEGKETLIAGVGDTSLYGAGNHNSLVGYDGSNGTKEGSTTFFVLGVSDGAVNTISGFEFVKEHNYIDAPLVTADNINNDLEYNYISNVAIIDDDLLMEVTKRGVGTKERALIVDAIDTVTGYGKDLVVNGVVAQVGENKVNVDKFASFYLATGTNATVNVDGSVNEKLSIWLGDDGRDMQFEGDFSVIDASNATGKAELAGNDLDNTILAGNGDNSLWGGNGGDDLLVGGTGKDSFYYVLGNGNDTIQSAGDGDSVILANMTLADITVDSVTSSAVAFNFSNGGKLTVNDNGNNVSFTVGEETYQLNGNREFERK